MRLVGVEEFVSRPVGCASAGATFLVWCAARDLAGTVAWGTPGEDDARVVARLWEFHHALPSGYDLIADLGELLSVDSSAFAVIAASEQTRRANYPQRVRRHALVRPAGMPGAVVAGFFAHLEMQHNWAQFDNAAAAFAWLERPDAESVRARVGELVAVAKPSPALAALRTWLDGHLASAELADAAHALRSSKRSLQRSLAVAGTSFRAEHLEARLRAAKRLLSETSDKIESVAERTGFSSTSRLARALREATGMTPQAYRDTVRPPRS